jgi:hypothetical protein
MRWTWCPALISLTISGAAWGASEIPAGRFVQVAADDSGGHYHSQVIFAPTVHGLVSWGTRVHGPPMRAHETQIYLPAENRWIDAWPRDKAAEWQGKFKNWGDWEICAPAGRFYERDGIPLPRPNSTFYQCAWDEHNGRIVYYVGSMTFSFQPRKRQWTLIHDRNVTAQPPALLLWSSLCYDPVNRQILLFGGGGVNAFDGRPHTWALDITTDTWKRLALNVEPPARCNSRMVYDNRNKAIVLFGGDGQDRGLADTWIFDVTRQQWRERSPARSPHPRASHCMAFLQRSGLILLVGGSAVAPWREQKRLSRQAWVYDPAANTWKPLAVEVPTAQWASMEAIPGTDEVVLVTAKRGTHERQTYRFRYDRSIPVADHVGVPPGTVAWKTKRTAGWYGEAPPADRNAHAALLATLTANRWIEVTPPRSTPGRTWGTAIFDTHRGVAMKWGGGHSGYQGTDMAFYDVATNRFTIDRTPAFTPDPFDRWARRPAGRTFFNQPWARHMRHTCAYDSVRRIGVFTDAGGSLWYDRESDAMLKHTWLYDPVERRWLEPIPQPFPGGGSVSPIAVSTPRGVLVYQHDASNTWEDNGRLYRFVGTPGEHATWGWEEIAIRGATRPHQREHMTIVYDTTRDRLIFLSHDRTTKKPALWFFSMAERSWTPNPHPTPGGVSTREAVYLPEADAILAYGPARDDDPIWTRVYRCAENRWVPLEIETPCYLVHEVALVYDPGRRLAVLLWPPAFERDLRPHLFRLDVDTLPGAKPKKKGQEGDDQNTDGTAQRDFSVGWTLGVKTAPRGKIGIVDAQGSEAFHGRADEEGACRAVLLQYRRTPEGKNLLTPHRVVARPDGKTVEISVTMDRAREVEIPP